MESRRTAKSERTPPGGVAGRDSALALAPATALAVGVPLPEKRATQRPAGVQALCDSLVHRPAEQHTGSSWGNACSVGAAEV